MIITAEKLRKRTSPVSMTDARDFAAKWGEGPVETDLEFLTWVTEWQWPLAKVVDSRYGEGAYGRFAAKASARAERTQAALREERERYRKIEREAIDRVHKIEKPVREAVNAQIAELEAEALDAKIRTFYALWTEFRKSRAGEPVYRAAWAKTHGRGWPKHLRERWGGGRIPVTPDFLTWYDTNFRGMGVSAVVRFLLNEEGEQRYRRAVAAIYDRIGPKIERLRKQYERVQRQARRKHMEPARRLMQRHWRKQERLMQEHHDWAVKVFNRTFPD